MLKEHMEKIAVEWELDAPFTETQGVWRIPVEDAYVILASTSESGEIALSADIAKVSLNKKEQCLQTLLNANLFGQGTAEFAVLGINPETGWVKLCALLPPETEYGFFSGTLEQFIILCDYWRDEMRAA